MENELKLKDKNGYSMTLKEENGLIGIKTKSPNFLLNELMAKQIATFLAKYYEQWQIEKSK